MKNNIIYTHDEAALMIDEFESLLASNGIKLPSPEDDEREPDNEACLYGSVYSDLLDSIESSLIDILQRQKDGADVVTYEFSGTV